ncbi:hypothetical protein HU200_005030 [Digitaria exilis]|uniref:Cystatin domain-containing protein n=1 Tax=Digitaria exilis TaxID=1010633 RepID=A0A835KSY7_9POAL|nr:hypothetical protein HU200_005030 [Digitaria exilis]
MSTRALRLLAVVVLLVVVVGNPIKDVRNPYIQELGGWAVSEYLRQSHSDGLLYGQVTSCEQYNAYKLTGVNYNLVLDAMDTTATVKNYRAIVLIKRRGTRVLKSFQLA